MHHTNGESNSFHLINKDLLEKSNQEQFAPFEKEGGLLPSFSIQIKDHSDEFLNKLIPETQVEDYTFFKSDESGLYFSFCKQYCCLSHDYKKAIVFRSDEKRVEESHELSYLLMLAYMYRLVSTGNFMIHAAATVYDGQAILFCGQSGAGKSTQASLWKKYLSTKTLNYDKPCIINYDGSCFAHGSPWSGKEKYYTNEYVPLKAIVFVKQAKHNGVVHLSKAQSFAHIFLHNYVYPISQEIESQYVDAIYATIEHTPVYELSCDISENAVKVLYNELYPNKNYIKEKKEYGMKYIANDCFEMKEIADEFILIPRGKVAMDYSSTVVFNESGAFLWKRLQSFSSKEDLIVSLENQYSIPHEKAINDVSAFLERMLSDQLIIEKQ